MLDALAVFFVIIFTFWYWKTWKHPKNFPPGPRFPVPLLGDAYVLGKGLDTGLQKLRKKYGDVCGLWMGPQRAVAIADYDILLDILNRPEFADRQQFATGGLMRKGFSKGTIPGVLFSNDDTWVDWRRSSLHTLRDFGLGKVALEEIIEDEIDNLIAHIDENHLNQPVDVRKFFNIAVLASLWRIVSGECLKFGDPKLDYLIDMVTIVVKEAGGTLTGVSMNVPLLFQILNKLGLVKFLEGMHALFDFNEEVVNNHKNRHIDGDHPLTFTEAMLHKIRETRDPDSTLFAELGEHNLINVLIDLFIAGSDTTSITMNWAMLFMIQNPQVQTKVRQELDDFYGIQKAKMSDRTNTPYTEAVIHEVQRRGNILPMSVFHQTATDVNYKGFYIPKKTMVIPLIGEVMHDPTEFPDPYKFDPDRYLSYEDGTLIFKPNPRVIPFGMGKRRCLGEALAKMSLYKFFSALVRKYDIVSGQKEPITDDSEVGFTRAPAQYLMVFKPRAK